MLRTFLTWWAHTKLDIHFLFSICMDENTIARFMKYVDKRPDGCWVWTGSARGGYGQFCIGSRKDYKMYLTHRLMYIYCYGEPEIGLDVCHKPIICHNRACCNPEHLEAKPSIQNQADRLIDKTDCRGIRHPRTTLTEEQVREIRKRFTEPHKTLCKEFNVSQAVISNIIHRRSWKYLI
jgi:hypothetical protein